MSSNTFVSTNVHHDYANDAAGFRFIRALACEKAGLDQRLGECEIRVLCALSYFMNHHTKRAWPNYEAIAEATGYSEDRIERALKKLREAGYIFTERRAPITGGRALVHYGLVAVSPEDLDTVVPVVTAALKERYIADAIRAIREQQKQLFADADPVKSNGVSNSHPGEINGVSAITPLNPTGSAILTPLNPPGSGFAHPVKSNGVIELTPLEPTGSRGSDPVKSTDSSSSSKEVSKRSEVSEERALSAKSPLREAAPKKKVGTRLSEDWVLPKSLGDWALAEFEVSVSTVRATAEDFKNHWLSDASPKAVKLSWEATWKKWCGSPFQHWVRRKSSASAHAPGLGLEPVERAVIEDPWAEVRQQNEARRAAERFNER